MSIHLCRDFITQGNASSPGTTMYATAIFLFHVLGFDFIQHRNFPLQSSSYEKGGTTVLSGNILFASINSGSATGYQVMIPTASYLVSSADLNRILALKSDNFPKANSGLFRITSASISDNFLTIDYRVNTGTLPPTDDRLRWRIYEQESIVKSTWSSGSNTPTQVLATGSSLRFGYRTWDAGSAGSLPASASRVILQSPDDSKWQVRLALESDYDVKSGSCQTGLTFAPGFFTSTPPYEAPGFKELHGPLYFNSSASLYQGTAVGPGPAMIGSQWTTGSWRILMWGDDETGTLVIVNRGLTLNASGWAAFGLPEDDHLYPTIAPDPNTMKRLFTMGSANAVGTLNWRSDFVTASINLPPNVNCVVWGDNEQPILAALSTYADVFNQTTHFRNITQAGTSSFGGYTEVIDVEILAGLFDTTQSTLTSSVYQFQPRRVGRFPLARLGSGKFGGIPSSVGFATWSHSSDVHVDAGTGPQWLHTEGGIFLPWEGPAIGGYGTGSLVWPMSGSIFDGEGLLSFIGNHPGYDPDPDPDPVPKDIDATRYRKTYSYYRQPVVETGVVKGGSNKPR